jgi:hypothetical protein
VRNSASVLGSNGMKKKIYLMRLGASKVHSGSIVLCLQHNLFF